MVIFRKGKGGTETLGNEVSGHASAAAGQDVASRVDGTNLSGSNVGRLGYCRQSPIAINAVCRESCKVKRTLWILHCGGF
jgi:hypothetical protein